MTEKAIDPMENRDEAYAGILSIMRLPYSRDLEGTDIMLPGVPYDPVGSIAALAGAVIAADVLYLI